MTRLHLTIVSTGLILLMALSSMAQQDFSFLQPVENNKYKKVLKQAKKEGKSVLFIAIVRRLSQILCWMSSQLINFGNCRDT